MRTCRPCRKAAQLLISTLEWRAKIDVGSLRLEEFEPEILSGKMYIQGRDEDGRAVMVRRADPQPVECSGRLALTLGPGWRGARSTAPACVCLQVNRKKADAFKPGQNDHYLRHLAFTLETACRSMQNGQESWIW